MADCPAVAPIPFQGVGGIRHWRGSGLAALGIRRGSGRWLGEKGRREGRWREGRWREGGLARKGGLSLLRAEAVQGRSLRLDHLESLCLLRP